MAMDYHPTCLIYLPDRMSNCGEANAITRTAIGKIYPIKGYYGDLPIIFRSSRDEVHMLLRNVAYVPSLTITLLS